MRKAVLVKRAKTPMTTKRWRNALSVFYLSLILFFFDVYAPCNALFMLNIGIEIENVQLPLIARQLSE